MPAEPKFKYPRPSKPEIMVVADISGSVAAFARFTLHLVYAISTQFSKVRAFVFIDGIDEVTRFFEGVEDITEAVHRVNTEADVVWVDGHSDYGHAFEVFWERWGKEVGPKTDGDPARRRPEQLPRVAGVGRQGDLRHKARHVYWLNPEPRSYWDTGDSIVSEYATHCDGVFECRNLRQLEALRRAPGLTFVHSVVTDRGQAGDDSVTNGVRRNPTRCSCPSKGHTESLERTMRQRTMRQRTMRRDCSTGCHVGRAQRVRRRQRR